MSDFEVINGSIFKNETCENCKQLKQQLESLKHDYREKLGYLSSNKWTDKTALSIEMERLEKEELRDRLEYEVKMIKSAAKDEINKLNQELKELKTDANMIIFHVFDNTIVLNEYPEVEEMCRQFLAKYRGEK